MHDTEPPPPPSEDEAGESARRPGTIQSISIATRFLAALGRVEAPAPLAALARETGTGRSTAHRYMQSLVQEGLATQDPGDGRYDLGPAALALGVAALRRVDAVEIAGAHMKRLAQEQAMSGGVAIWTGQGPVLVRWHRSAGFSISSLGLGDVLPLDNAACGLAFQAFLPRATVEAARRAQPADFRGEAPPVAAAGRDRLARIRAEGWAELTSHLLPGVTGQAAPILDAQGELACVVTTVTDLGRLKAPGDRYALQEVARVINRATGGMGVFERAD